MENLEIHIPICANKKTLVFQSPFQTNIDRFSSELLQKWLWVDRSDLYSRLKGSSVAQRKKTHGRHGGQLRKSTVTCGLRINKSKDKSSRPFYSIMSDREGHSGNGAPTDEDLSLPKATVAKMIAGL